MEYKVSENLVQYVVAAGNGDTDAMAKLYSKTLKASYFLASKLSGNETEAVEIIKKAYARAFCSIDKLKKPEAFEIWLKQIVAAIYKDGANFIFNDADGSAQEACAEFLPEAVLEDETAAAEVMAAVSKLTAERKAALILHYYTGMPASALAKYFGVSESTANAILAKAKADVSETSGVSAPEYPELASLPVLTRLFKDLVAKTGIDNSAVRDIFVFAIEAYAEAKPKDVIPENEPAEEAAEEKEEPVADEKVEETAQETAEDEAEEQAEEAPEEPAAEPEEEAETEAEPEETEAVEAEEETVEDVKNEMEENILSFKNKISSMLGAETETETVSEEAESEPEAEPVKEDSEKENSEAMPIDDDAFEKIKRSIEGMADEAQTESAFETEDENAVAFADFAQPQGLASQEPEEAVTQEKPAKSPSKKAVKINPKFIIAAAAILVVIIVAVVLIVKGGKDNNGENVTEPPTVGYSNESVTWVALPELSDYEEIEYLNESFNSFKDPDTGKYGLIDYQGNVVLSAEYDGFRRCSSGRYYGDGKLSDSGYHIVAEKGGSEYEVVMLDESSATLSNKAHTAHATTNSTSMGGGDYDERDRYYEGYAAVRKDGKWGYVAQGGKIVVPYEFEAVNNVPTDDPTGAFDYCRGSVNGYVAVKKDGKMGIIRIDKDSYRIVADYKYDMICQGKNGVFLAYNGTEWGNIVIGSASGNNGGESETTTLTPVETQPAEVSIGNYVVASDETNIRSAPDTEKENIIAALNAGYEIAALEIKEGSNGSDWVRFDYNGQEAWVSIKKLEKAD